MFLNQLSAEEKEAFISLSIHASNSNGIFAEEEKAMIQEYCREMGILFFDAGKAKSMVEIVEIFKKADLHIKKVVLLEILGLIYSDGLFDDAEREFIRGYASDIGLTDEDVDKQIAVMKEYLQVLKKIAEVVA